MVSALGAAASGFRDAAVRVDVAAHNIANVNTAGFQPAQVDSVELAGGGVAPVVGQPATAGPPAPTLQPSGTDLAQETIRLVIALVMLTATARTIEAAASVDHTLLDTRA